MKIPTLKGIIDRRILINFTATPEIIQKIIPAPFRPLVYRDKAIVGICLIRLKHIRPKGLPAFIGIASENGAHRVAVEWEENGQTKQGVYIPRRDTSSKINSLAGGRIFPGKHYHAKFDIDERDGNYSVAFKSSDNTSITIEAERTESFNPASIFQTLENASEFFRNGSDGYSPDGNIFQGMKLNTIDWKVEPLQVKSVTSSFFEDRNVFPEGSVQFDNALLMTKLEHEWNTLPDKPLFKKAS